MRTIRTLQIAARNLSSHAFRSSLTALGVVFGVGAVVGMMAISEGARRESIRQIEALGIDHIVVRSIKPLGEGNAAAESSWSAVEFGITANDIRHISTVFENISSVIAVKDTRKAIYANGKRTEIQVLAVEPGFTALTSCRLIDTRSRFLTESDTLASATTCLVGRDAARILFGFRDPIDQSLLIDTALFQVKGVYYNPYNVQLAGGANLNKVILIPFATANSLFGKVARAQSAGSSENSRVEADYLYIRVKSVDFLEETSARLRTYFASTHKTFDYEIQVPYELLKQKEATQAIFTVVMASIAAISLLVGGIGIMNIMMANVYERTREIGTRRALGARKVDILVQFMAESILLTCLGGVAGIVLGVALAEIVQRVAGWETAVAVVSVAVSLSVSVLVGVAFGTYPAWKAANLDPITALRTE